MTTTKAKELLHGVVLTMWARKQMEKDRLEVKPIGEYFAEVNARRNNTRMGVSFSVGGIALLLALAFFWTYHSPEVNVATVLLFGFELTPVCAAIVWGVYCLTARKIPEVSGVVKCLVSEYFELRQLLSKGDLWDRYVRVAIKEESFEANFQCWSTTKLVRLPGTLVDQAAYTLHRIGSKVADLGQSKSSLPASLSLKTHRLIPAFRAAVKVGIIDGRNGYEQFIPKNKPKRS